MKTYEKLAKEFNEAVERLQKKCPHKKSHWAEEWWAMCHSTGNRVEVCDCCRKVLRRKEIK